MPRPLAAPSLSREGCWQATGPARSLLSSGLLSLIIDLWWAAGADPLTLCSVRLLLGSPAAAQQEPMAGSVVL